MEVEYWSTLTTKGKKRCSKVGEGGKGLQWTAVRRKHLSPLSSPTIMDKQPIFFQGKTRESVTLCRSESMTSVLCVAVVNPRPEELLNSVQCAFLLLFNLNLSDIWFDFCLLLLHLLPLCFYFFFILFFFS